MNHFANCFCDHLFTAESCFESGYIGKCQNRNIKCITEFNESSCFSCTSCRKSSVEFFCFISFCVIYFCSVRYCTDCCSIQTKETGNNIFTIVFLCFEENTIISDSGKCNRCITCACCDIIACTVQIICAFYERIIVFEVRWKKSDQLTDLSEDFFFRTCSVYKTCFFTLECSCSCITFFSIVSIQCVRAVYEHFTVFGFDECEICKSRDDCHTTTTCAKYSCDLWNHSGSQCLFQVDGSECFESVGSFLKTHTCTVNKTDHRSSSLHCKVIQSGNLSGMHFTNSSV